MFWLALAFSIPAILVTAVIPVWAAWQLGQAVTNARDSLVLGLDMHGLYYLVGTIGLVLLKFGAPALTRETWRTQRGTALFFIFTWFGAVVLSTGFVFFTIRAPLVGMTDHSDLHVLLVVSWPLLDVIASLLPAAFMSPQDWRHLRSPRESNAPPCNVPVSHERTAPSPPCLIKDHLLRVVRDLAMQAPGFVIVGVYLTGAGEIITSQGTLAHMLGVSKSTINRSLQALRAEGQIRLCASARETKITVLGSCEVSHLERSGTTTANG